MPEVQKSEMTLWRLLKQWVEEDLGLKTKLDILHRDGGHVKAFKILLMDLQMCEIHWTETEVWTSARGVTSDPIRVERPDMLHLLKINILTSVALAAEHFEKAAARNNHIARQLRDWVTLSIG